MRKSTLIFMLLLIVFNSEAQTLAFPGAEGFGCYTTGGRGGTVYYVNNLSDINSGDLSTHEGSLRWCLNQSGIRTILFKVSGTILLTSQLKISQGNVTIAGQTAPGEGICVGGFPVSFSASNIIVRYLRFRMGQEYVTNADGADAFGGRGAKNIIVDHCSMSWSTDECVSIYSNENTTLQWCIISESLRLAKHSKGPHGYGGIWGGNHASFHHNLMAHNDSRTPRLGPGTNTELSEYTDIRNNVIYNWSGNGCYGGEAMHVNIVNNYYKPGPATPTGSKRGRIIAIDKKTGLPATDGFYPINNIWGTFYIDGNYIDASTSTASSDIAACNNATSNNWDYGVYNQISSTYGITPTEKIALKLSSPLSFGNMTTHNAQQAYENVLAFAGASLHRDSHDLRIINETRTGTSTFKGLSKYNGLGVVTYPAGTVIGVETLAVATTIDWKSTSYPKNGIIDSEIDIKPVGADSSWTPWPQLASGTVLPDSNRDGIPDGWLETNYPGKTSIDKNADGFTYLEVYLNSIVQSITAQENEKGNFTDLASVRNKNVNVTGFYSKSTKTVFVQSSDNIHRIRIFNLAGLKIMEVIALGTQQQINVASIPDGVFFVQVFNDENQEPKVIKILKSI